MSHGLVAAALPAAIVVNGASAVPLPTGVAVLLMWITRHGWLPLSWFKATIGVWWARTMCSFRIIGCSTWSGTLRRRLPPIR